MDKKLKILIIEDEQILGELLFQKLSEEEYLAFWEVDGEAGIRKMREILPDMVLLDIVMPKKDGYQVLEEMQKDISLQDIPVIVISNSGQPVEIKKILEFGVKDYIIKAQFSPEEVLKKIRKHLNQEDAVGASVKNNYSDLTLLVIEDDTFLNSLMVRRLLKEGYNVLSAEDGVQALKILETEIPDLIILDLIMPEMNGLEILKKIKADPKYNTVSVIILSNLGQEHEIEESKKLGAEDFLVKANFTPKEITDRINAILKKKGRL